MHNIEHYLRPTDGKDVYLDWLGKLKDTTAKIAVIKPLIRVEMGNLGDRRFCRDGVSEL